MERHFCVESEREKRSSQLKWSIFRVAACVTSFCVTRNERGTDTSLRFAKFLVDDKMKLKMYCLARSNEIKPKNRIAILR